MNLLCVVLGYYGRLVNHLGMQSATQVNLAWPSLYGMSASESWE